MIARPPAAAIHATLIASLLHRAQASARTQLVAPGNPLLFGRSNRSKRNLFHENPPDLMA
jgi:hypothetical protein